eukprot:11198060-Ditylum_brightwellii.AAC.1
MAMFVDPQVKYLLKSEMVTALLKITPASLASCTAIKEHHLKLKRIARQMLDTMMLRVVKMKKMKKKRYWMLCMLIEIMRLMKMFLPLQLQKI